ncbi:MAG: cytochrome P460 family protein [Roseitalea porphyridii]|jgi:hypothetical protein|uniref:cytochrome P460 family protein n=1 Tax=Roseitalea porphyridii TaxID=1852022 RepID=UPI0032EF06FA
MPVRSLSILTGCALALSATAVLAQDFGTEEDQDYAAQLWQLMLDRDLAGDDAVQAFPYPGTDPHGMMLETFYTRATVDDHSGALVIKRNYGPQGVTVDQVIGDREQHLGAVTIMFRRGDGYAPETNDWFWAKYLPDGSLDEAPDGTPLAGRAKGCISCHSTADGGDLLFTTNADLN